MKYWLVLDGKKFTIVMVVIFVKKCLGLPGIVLRDFFDLCRRKREWLCKYSKLAKLKDSCLI
jgi:hypothetical protein